MATAYRHRERPAANAPRSRGIVIAPSTPTIGAEITGIDLNLPLGDERSGDHPRGLAAPQVIFFRNQDVDYSKAISGSAGCSASSRAIRSSPMSRAIPKCC